MQTTGPPNVAIGHGMVFDYFDEIRKTIEAAGRDTFFVDPYLDADFVSRYLVHAKPGLTIRLLAREKPATLLAAVEAFALQSGANITIRSSPGFHDRYVFVDSAACYQSGASFKDGGRNASTTLTQITDAFPAMQQTHEGLWNKATVIRLIDPPENLLTQEKTADLEQ